MSDLPPSGSTIEIEELNGHKLIVVPHGSGGVMRYAAGIFLFCWLGGWALGFAGAFGRVLSGDGSAFLIFWLGGWSVAGLFAFFMIYRLFRKCVPEKILLNRPHLSFDTGMPPLKLSFGFGSQRDYWKALFQKQKRFEFQASEIASLTLRENTGGNRLTIDKGSERVELGVGGTEIDREWLYEFLTRYYKN